MPSFASQFIPHHRVCLPSSGLILTQAKPEIYLDSIASGMLGQPTPVRQALGKELREVYIKGGAILQYTDDTLTCSPTREASDQSTIEVLNFLETQGYRVREEHKFQSNR